ncbi:MAG TPA: aldo/keto reductase [Polyangiaceae bacterium]|nr:aldo/keto reductase [Polyangiaceae bacterium]
MKYRRLGNTGLVVSVFSLGTMQFGRAMQMGGLGQQETDAMLGFAIDRGINFIDTADAYSRGESETLLGKAMQGSRGSLVVATKARLPMSDTDVNASGATRVNLLREVEASLRRLKTDYIDLYQIHGWDSNTPLEETLRTLDDIVRSGKARYIGLSNYMAWQAATALSIQEREHLEKYVTAQMYYSLVGRELEHEWLSFAEYHKLGLLIWSPLAGGFLTGKYKRSAPAPEGSRFADAGRFVPFDVNLGERVIAALATVAERHAATPAQVALAWLLERPAVSSIIIAARSNERLQENIGALDLRLEQDDLRLLNEVSDPGTPYPKWMVLQVEHAEDPRSRALQPERFAAGVVWKDLRGSRWSG